MSAREPSLFDFWGREVVKDGVLLLLAMPPLVGLLFVPMGLSNGRWLPPLAVVVGGGVLWWLVRRGLRAWVARGGRPDDGVGGSPLRPD